MVAMTVRGLVLITVCFANALTAQVECCKCDCQQAGLPHSQLLYLPIVSPHLSGAAAVHDQGIYQSLRHVSLPNVARYSQAVYSPGHQVTTQYHTSEAIENSLDTGSKVGVSIASLGLQKAPQQSLHFQGQGLFDSVSAVYGESSKQQGLQKSQEQSFSHLGEQESLNSLSSLSSISSGNHGQQQVSKVSTHQGDHYINIEQQVSPHESSSVHHDNSLDHEKEHHHHGKNDYYKFEYGVNDHHTHDVKSHKEEKKGDVVQGEYSLLEDNGNVRTVKYYADWKTGFHAQVHNSKTTALG